MAKRFSETKIWEDEWYQSLPTKWKIVWKYLCDKCDEAGIWKPNFKLADFQINEKIKWAEATHWLNNGKIRVVITEKAWVLKDFVPFQYGEAVYASQHGFHKKIRSMLSRYPIDTLCNRVQEEEEVKEEDKVKVIKGGVGGFRPPTLEEVQAYCLERGNGIDAKAFIAHYETSGWIRGKTPIKNWKACVLTWEGRKNERTGAHNQNTGNDAERVERKKQLDSIGTEITNL